MSAAQQILAAFGQPVDYAAWGGMAYLDTTGAGTFSFVVPGGVTDISMLCVGAGGGGGAVGGGGGAGACAYTNNVTVTPGETLTIEVGAGGISGTTTAYASGSAGGNSAVKRSSTVLVQANGGGGGTDAVGGGGATGGTGTVLHGGGAGGRDEVGDYGGTGGSSGNPSTYGSVGTPAWASTIYRGGGRGGGITLTDGSWSQAENTSVSATRHGVLAFEGAGAEIVAGAGGGGGAWGDAGHTLVGNGGYGANGAVVLIWGGRMFSASSSF